MKDKTKNTILIISGLTLLTLVIIGVIIIEPITQYFECIAPFNPIIVITGFFTFLVAVSLFVYGIINSLRK